MSVRRRAQPLRAGEQLITGRLLDFESAEPIAQGLVRLLRDTGESAASTLSDDEGLFWLVSPVAGTYRLQGERIGYKTSTGPELHLMIGDTLGLDFYLSMEAIVLDPLVVRATARPLTDRYGLEGMEGFLRRYSIRHNQGEFLTRDSIAKYESLSSNVICGRHCGSSSLPKKNSREHWPLDICLFVPSGSHGGPSPPARSSRISRVDPQQTGWSWTGLARIMNEGGQPDPRMTGPPLRAGIRPPADRRRVG